MNNRIASDISASDEDREQALLDAMLSGQPLTIFDSSTPDVPPLEIVMELGLAGTEAE